MRFHLSVVLLTFLFSGIGLAEINQPPHLDLEASSQELRRALKWEAARVQALGQKIEKNEAIENALEFGERLLVWVDLINANRPDDQKIRLTSPETRRGIPITAPSHYSPRSVSADLELARVQMPQAMRDVLFSSAALPTTNPVSDEDFIKYGRLVDRVYQTAARWQTLIPYKSYYISNRAKDIRGYYYLTTNNWDAATLNNWENILPSIQNEIREALISSCLNSRGTYNNCKRNVDAIDSGAKAVNLYRNYMPVSTRVYNSFFAIQNARRDVSWSAKNEQEASIPFFDPVRSDVRHFIKHNIEEEFSWLGWGLKINFVDKKPAPYVVFIPGQTANVEALGGNKIEMDANKSLDEYEEQWTIRHEFGHVLGMPDCYHEFFDTVADEFINYQIDVTDLMCSRAGNMTERIFEQLKTAYRQ